MSRIHTHVNKGDEIVVISGAHRGATGKILQVIPEKGRVLIEGVRMIKKHVRKSQDHPNGAIIEREGPVHISNVKKVEVVADKKTSKPEKSAKGATKDA